MTIKEIITEISAHQVEGMMLHNDMADYYDFLGLMGFKRMHEYRFFSESASMRGVHRYFINHFNMLLDEEKIITSSYIPFVWRDYTRKNVEVGAKKNAVISSMDDWVKWEHNTKSFLENKYRELCELGEYAAARKVMGLIAEVDQEAKCADRLMIKLKSVDFDMPTIICMQDELNEKYDEKTKEIGVSIC